MKKLLLLLMLPLALFGADKKPTESDLGKRKRDEQKGNEQKKLSPALAKLEEMRIKHRKKTENNEVCKQVEQIIKERGEQGKPCCFICKVALDRSPKILLHNAPTSNSNVSIPHEFHIQCLATWLQKSCDMPYLFMGVGADNVPVDNNEDDEEEIEAESESLLGEDTSQDNENIAITCTLCVKPFEINFGVMRKAYIESLNKLTLKEKFLGLDTLPIAFALDTLNKYEKLKTDEKSAICSAEESDIILQKFTIKKINIWFKKSQKEYAFWAGSKRLDKINKLALDTALDLLEDRPITLEFVRLIVLTGYFTDNETVQEYFKRALQNDKLLMPSGGSTECEEDDFDELPTTPLPENTPPEVRETIKHRARVRMAEACLSYFPKEEQFSYFNHLVNKTSITICKKYTVNKLFPVLSRELQIGHIDDLWTQLSAHAKTTVLNQTINELTQLKGKPFVVEKLHDLARSYYRDERIINSGKLLKKLNAFVVTFANYLGQLDPAIVFAQKLALTNQKVIGAHIAEFCLANNIADPLPYFAYFIDCINFIAPNFVEKITQSSPLLEGFRSYCTLPIQSTYEYLQNSIIIPQITNLMLRDRLHIKLFETVKTTLANVLTLAEKEKLLFETADRLQIQNQLQIFLASNYYDCVLGNKRYLLYYFACPPAITELRNSSIKITLEGAVPQNYFIGIQKTTDRAKQLDVFKNSWPLLEAAARYPALLLALTYMHPDDKKEIIKLAPLETWLKPCNKQVKVGVTGALCNAAVTDIRTITNQTINCCLSEEEVRAVFDISHKVSMARSCGIQNFVPPPLQNCKK